MYIVDLFKRITHKSNLTVFIYLVFNVFVIGGIISYLFTVELWKAVLLGLGLYIASLLIALSPFGEWILRLQTGCRKIKRVDQLSFIEPLFLEVYARAKRLDPSIPDDVRLYMNESEAPNAFATGRKTICLTEGMLHLPEEQIKAAFAHEFGHLAHKDTDLILIVSVGNLIVNVIMLSIRLIIDFFHIIFSFVALLFGGSEGALAMLIGSLYKLGITLIVAGLTWIWTKIGVLLVMKASRENEYGADEFAFNIGYGDELCVLLDSFQTKGAKGLFASLASSHPDESKRIARLQELGATYRTTYGGDGR